MLSETCLLPIKAVTTGNDLYARLMLFGLGGQQISNLEWSQIQQYILL